MGHLFKFFRRHLELIFWITALVLLFLITPDKVHFTLCPLSNLGFDFCPGCGVGHSIHYAMWLDLQRSFGCHPLGVVALFIIIYRITQLIILPFKLTNHE
ncbi:MAG: DUF2752 domain-containing protein [bacterium]|jgi:hypothetical protein